MAPGIFARRLAMAVTLAAAVAGPTVAHAVVIDQWVHDHSVRNRGTCDCRGERDGYGEPAREDAERQRTSPPLGEEALTGRVEEVIPSGSATP